MQKKYLAKPHIKNDLVYIKSNLSNFPTSLSKLPTEGISLTDSPEVVDNVSVNETSNWNRWKIINWKIQNVLKENVGLDMLKKI